jgi:hypothetical protein
MNRIIRITSLLFLLLLQAANLAATSYPVPDNVSNVLFYIERSLDSNVVVYQLNTDKSGKPDENEPIKVFWIRHTEGGIHKNLTSIQQSMSYGVVILSHDARTQTFVFRFAGYSKRVFLLKKSPFDNQYHVFGLIGSIFGIIENIYINITGGSFWIPTIEHVDLIGQKVQDKSIIKEQIKP